MRPSSVPSEPSRPPPPEFSPAVVNFQVIDDGAHPAVPSVIGGGIVDEAASWVPAQFSLNFCGKRLGAKDAQSLIIGLVVTLVVVVAGGASRLLMKSPPHDSAPAPAAPPALVAVQLSHGP